MAKVALSLRGVIRAAFLCYAVALSSVAFAEEPALRVATRIVPPFVMRDGDKLSGFSIELWNAIAEHAGKKFALVEKGTLPEMMNAVKLGEADAAISAISITADREELFDFSQPIFAAGVQIMVRAQGAQGNSLIPSFVAFFTSRPFFQLMGALLALIIIPAPLIWWLERRYEASSVAASSTPAEFAKSMFWSATTVIGQTSGHPHSWPGRIIALVWMVTGVTFISYFTASVTSALTVEQLQSTINGLKDIGDKRIATVAGSSSASFLQKRGLNIALFSNVGQAIQALSEQSAEAVVYDAPVLLYYAAHEGEGKVRLVGPVLRPEDYGVLLPIGGPNRKWIDEALLALRESGDYQRLYERWFKAPSAEGG